MAVNMKNLTPRQRAAFHFICNKQGWTALRAPSYTMTQEQLIESLADFADEQAIAAYDDEDVYDPKDNGNQGS